MTAPCFQSGAQNVNKAGIGEASIQPGAQFLQGPIPKGGGLHGWALPNMSGILSFVAPRTCGGETLTSPDYFLSGATKVGRVF